MPSVTPEDYISPLFSGSSPEAFTAGEGTARALGWVHTLREWLGTAASDGADALSDDPVRSGGPSFRDLSRAMAYLYDSGDPVSVGVEASSGSTGGGS